MARRIVPTTLLAVAVVTLSGCGGPKMHPVSGTVTLDNNPVEGATVVFASDDGKKTFAGVTDASGKYTISGSGNKDGAEAGSYKVLITKSKGMSGDASAGSADYMKHMEKAAKENAKASGGPGPGPAMPPSSPTAAAGANKSKGDLPGMYSTAGTTPFTVKVPADGPQNFDLKTDKKK